jgi:hypothetical protein
MYMKKQGIRMLNAGEFPILLPEARLLAFPLDAYKSGRSRTGDFQSMHL